VPTPLIKVTATRAKMEALIRNTIIGSPRAVGWNNPRKAMVIAASTSLNTRFCLLARRDDAAVRYQDFSDSILAYVLVSRPYVLLSRIDPSEV
jgi:hypothetical protein